MRWIRYALAGAALALAASPASARPDEVGRALPGAQQVGEARYHMLAIALFDAELWSRTGAFSWNEPFALSLTYARDFRAHTLANRGLVEMAGRGAGSAASLEPLRAPLTACFADVREGDRITGVSTGANTARFFYNGAPRCEIEWPNFRRHFFGIWLDAGGGHRAFSAQLRGET